MNTVVPPSGTPAAQQGAAPPSSSVGQAVSIPNGAVSLLKQGQNISGQVVAKPEPGQVTVQTPQGNVTLQTPNPPPQGASVNLILQAAGPPAQIQIQTQSLQVSLLEQANSLLSKLINAPKADAPPPQSVVTTLTQGSTFLATILGKGQPLLNAQGQAVLSLSTTGAQQAVTGQTAPATGGTASTGSAQPANNVPPGQAGNQSAAQTAGTQTAQPPATGQPAQAAPASSNTSPLGKIAQVIKQVASGKSVQTQVQLPTGHTVPMRVLNIALPGGAQLPPYPQSAAKSGNMLLTGNITASNAGQSIVQTSAGSFALPTSQPLPIGTSLQLMVTGQPQPSAAASQMNAADMGLRWQALQEAMALMQAGNPAAAQRLLQIVPQSSPTLGTTLLFLFNAMRGGSIDRWLGKDTMKALEAAKKGSAGRLAGSFQAAQGRVTDPAGQDWRVYHMPVLADGNLDDVKLYLRDKAEDEDSPAKDKDSEDKRFIVEANFATIGPMQFDGMSRKKQLDLMIRTQIPLEEEMRDGIRHLFHDTISALGLSGGVQFHVAKQFEITADEMKSASKKGVTI